VDALRWSLRKLRVSCMRTHARADHDPAKPRTEANPETSVGVLDVVQPQDGLGGEVLARLAFRAGSIQKGLLYLHTPFYEVDHVKVRAPLCRKPVIGMAPARRMDEGSQRSASFAGARSSHGDIHEPGRRRDRHPQYQGRLRCAQRERRHLEQGEPQPRFARLEVVTVRLIHRYGVVGLGEGASR